MPLLQTGKKWEMSKKPTMSGNEAALMVGNIDETSPQSQRPENSPTQDGSSEELFVYNPQEQKRDLHYYSRLVRSFHFSCLAASASQPPIHSSKIPMPQPVQSTPPSRYISWFEVLFQHLLGAFPTKMGAGRRL